MTSINRSALVMHSAQQMFDLVNDVEKYPQFVNGCVGAEIIEQSDTHMVARLSLKRAGLSYDFVTRNTLTAPDSIAMQLQEGPFERLTGVWRFKPLREDACKVEMELDFAVSAITGLAIGGFFGQVAGNMVASFCERADKIYGG